MAYRKYLIVVVVITIVLCTGYTGYGQPDKSDFRVIAYYSGNATAIDSFPVEKLTHIIYSFCHLKGNQLYVDNQADSATIRKLVALKHRNKQLKILLSLGGWGGCKTCSDVFSTHDGRTAFAASVKNLADYFKTDGLDLDWEYPAIEGPPGHPFKPEDRNNFTSLVIALREALGPKQEISFAAGGFEKFLEQSIDWEKVMTVVDFVNLMNYDMVNGATPHTGHHTPLYSTREQKESVDECVNYLLSIGVPRRQMVIGAAFYGRSWERVEDINNGLYQPGVFKSFIPAKKFDAVVNEQKGFAFYYDTVAQAHYAYNKTTKTFVTFDDAGSISKKARYTKDQGLGGIMFWELTLDKKTNGYVELIYQTINDHKN